LKKFEPLVSLYPGSSINPKYWNDPAWAGPEPFRVPVLPDGYEAVDRPGYGLKNGESSIPIRIRIPDIGLIEAVKQLDLFLYDDGSRYENPDRIVGHIPETANPGENGTGWYFGHQSNFGTDEGAVFARVPEIFNLLSQDPVYVYIDTAIASFAYRVYETKVVPRGDLTLSSAPGSTITLVASWPPFVFDQRFLAVAELVGVKRGSQ
jgi:sortase (surface protein transpeptidase)